MMADDIDEMLREVEEKYLPAESATATSKRTEAIKANGRSRSDFGYTIFFKK